MAVQNEFTFTNTSKLDEGIKLTHLDLVNNYGVREETAERVVLDNVTANLDGAEYITFTCRDIKQVDTTVPVAKKTDASGVMYGVKVEAIRKKYDTFSDSYIADEPIVCEIKIRHPKTDEWETSAPAIFERAYSALYYVLNSGGSSPSIVSRIPKLMRSQERPTEETTLDT